MADTAHRLTDEKLEEMEKRLSAIYSRAEKTVQKKMADYAKSIDEKSAELLQAYNDADIVLTVGSISTTKQTSIIYNRSDGTYYLWRSKWLTRKF